MIPESVQGSGDQDSVLNPHNLDLVRSPNDAKLLCSELARARGHSGRGFVPVRWGFDGSRSGAVSGIRCGHAPHRRAAWRLSEAQLDLQRVRGTEMPTCAQSPGAPASTRAGSDPRPHSYAWLVSMALCLTRAGELPGPIGVRGPARRTSLERASRATPRRRHPGVRASAPPGQAGCVPTRTARRCPRTW
jgi:hypothetical protein